MTPPAQAGRRLAHAPYMRAMTSRKMLADSWAPRPRLG